MEYMEAQSLKTSLTNLIKKGCCLKIPKYGVDGRLDCISFKPHLNDHSNYKIEKIEFNVLDNYGQVVPFNFCPIKGCEVLTHDNKSIEESENISLNILVSRPTHNEHAEKIRIDISLDESR